MSITVFNNNSYSLHTLIELIDRGEIALPDIQRPFVWKPSKVRDLFDSMYRGFPVGNLLFWATGAQGDARQIGVHDHEAVPRLMIVDGQQRLTSLYSVLRRKAILREDYTTFRIRIAFCPRDEKFAVTDAAVEKNAEYIPDISILWHGGNQYEKEREFIERLEATKSHLTQGEKDDLRKAINKLYALRNYPFNVLELEATVEEEHVADVFVRINSEGINLSSADFILTLMSVWWEDGRKKLESFARNAKLPPSEPSPANPFIDPKPDQMLRVITGFAFRRGRLQYVYRILRGKDMETGKSSSDIQKKQFTLLQKAQAETLDLNNWHEFLYSVRRAGFLDKSMISSENNLMFTYLMYLIARRDYDIDRRTLRQVISKWFFMTSLTGRYTGSFETQVEQDLRIVAKAKTSDEFIEILDEITQTTLTSDYWKIQLPALLKTSSAYNPRVFAYKASLILLNAHPLFSSTQLVSLLDQSSKAPRDAVERHHLFPKAYLKRIGIERVVDRNQIANYAFVEWPDNSIIADQSPSEYFPPLFNHLQPEEQKNARFWHALPNDWERMDYWDFLEKRRKLMADVIRKGFEKLCSSQFVDQEVSSGYTKKDVAELIAGAETDRVEFKSSAYYSYRPGVPENVIKDSVIKTVAGFLNADGGTLAIGIGDDGEILGIQPDLDQKNMDTDRYVNSLTNMFASSLGPLAVTMVSIQLQSVDGSEVVALINVNPSPDPIYARVSKGNQIFFVRVNNSTRVLEAGDLVAYVKDRWP